MHRFWLLALAAFIILSSIPARAVVPEGALDNRARLVGGCLTLPEGYTSESEKGPDFTVERVKALPGAAAPDAMIGVYTGNYPSFQVPKGAKKEVVRTKIRKLTWYYWIQSHGESKYHHFEARWVVEGSHTDDDEPPLQYHLFVTGTNLDQVQALKRLVESISKCE